MLLVIVTLHLLFEKNKNKMEVTVSPPPFRSSPNQPANQSERKVTVQNAQEPRDFLQTNPQTGSD